MKTQIQCTSCGLNNKASSTNCIRCYASLAGLPVAAVSIDAPGQMGHTFSFRSIPLWIKLGAGAVVLLVVLVALAAFSLALTAKKSYSNRYAHYENAIRVSPKFNEPVTEDVGRYTYYDNDGGGTQQEATPAAYKLSEQGLIYIHVGQYSDVTTNYNSRGNIVIDPRNGLVPRSYQHISLEPIGAGQAQSVNWESYENKRDGKVGWKVPIGDRELLRVVQVMTDREMGGTSDGMMVSFTWKWKPNEIGQAFDRANPSYVAPKTPRSFGRSSFDVEVNNSKATYWGTAELIKIGDGWEVGRVSWAGTGGVRLSPNQSAEIDEIIKQSQNR